MTDLELINIICPEHNRTSCSDDNISNGFYTDSNDEYDKTISHKYGSRCPRCALLELKSEEKVDTNKIIKTISIYYKY